MLERAAVIATMIAVLMMLGFQLEHHTWALVSILALALLLEYMGYQSGVVDGMDTYRQLDPAKRAEVDKILKGE